jgi:hypothetical protein
MSAALSWPIVLQKLQTQPTVSVPEAGYALAELGRNASYKAAEEDKLGVPVLKVGGKKRVPSVPVLRKLGLESALPPPVLPPPPATPTVIPGSLPAKPANKPRRRRADDREAQSHTPAE